MGRRTGLGIIVFVLLAASGLCVADVLVLKDGKTYEGKLISQDSREVVFEVHRFGSQMVMTFEAAAVASVTKKDLPPPPTRPSEPASRPVAVPSSRPAGVPAEVVVPPVVSYEGPTYYLIPLRGEVGKTFTADILRASLNDAAQRKPTVVVLEIDSTGGLIDEVEKILEVLVHFKKQNLRIVVLAKQAISAAAVSALAADEIYMRQSAVIGAATPYRFTVSGIPQTMQEKMQSVWRAQARAAADMGKHPSLLAEGMIDNRMQLYLSIVDGRPEIKETAAKGDRLIKASGKLLTLTAREAVEYGLASGVADDLSELAMLLQLDNWSECRGIGTALADHWQKKVEAIEKEFKAIIEQFEKYMREARVNNPARYNDYYLSPQTGMFTPDSQRRWQERSQVCIALLGKAEKELEKAAALAAKYPNVLPDAEDIARSRQEISVIRQSVAKQAYTPG